MTYKTWMLALVVIVPASLAAPRLVTANDDDARHHDDDDRDDRDDGPRCRPVRGELIEDRVTTGCNPGLPSCYLGELRGLGLRATTHFRGDASAAGPSTSPGWISYSGPFEYRNARGTITTRETGVVNVSATPGVTGAITAMQVITGGTGRYAGATGHLFVAGFNVDDHIVTEVHGELCRP